MAKIKALKIVSILVPVLIGVVVVVGFRSYKRDMNKCLDRVVRREREKGGGERQASLTKEEESLILLAAGHFEWALTKLFPSNPAYPCW